VDLQSLFNIAARKGKASSIFVPPQQQRSFIETVTQQPQRASTVFIPQQQMPSYLETAAQQPQQASTVFIPQKQMPSFLDTATKTVSVSPLFRFPKAGQKPQAQAPAAVPSRDAAAAPMVVAPVTRGGATPIATSAGVVQPNAIVQGLTPTGEVDRTQGDEYKSQMAQYQNLIKQQKAAEAEDLGMKIWMEKYGKRPMAQAGGAIGAYNPLLAATFPETSGYAGTFAAPEEIQMGDLGTRAQGEMGPTMESLNPLASQAAQQEATATQADMATTAGLSAGDRARNLTRAFRLGLI
jgi:hypothetical protein